jgi:hypothetical protein
VENFGKFGKFWVRHGSRRCMLGSKMTPPSGGVANDLLFPPPPHVYVRHVSIAERLLSSP